MIYLRQQMLQRKNADRPSYPLVSANLRDLPIYPLVNGKLQDLSSYPLANAKLRDRPSYPLDNAKLRDPLLPTSQCKVAGLSQLPTTQR